MSADVIKVLFIASSMKAARCIQKARDEASTLRGLDRNLLNS
jgi:hypothetical protein